MQQLSRQTADVPLSHGRPHYVQARAPRPKKIKIKRKAKNKLMVTERGKNMFTVGAGQGVSVSQDPAVKKKKKKEEVALKQDVSRYDTPPHICSVFGKRRESSSSCFSATKDNQLKNLGWQRRFEFVGLCCFLLIHTPFCWFVFFNNHHV